MGTWEPSIHDRLVLVVAGEVDLFVWELQDALDKAGAESLIVKVRI